MEFQFNSCICYAKDEIVFRKQWTLESARKDQEYHITSFEWVTILDVAKIISNEFPGTVINPAKSKDNVQQDKRNEADLSILNYWKPEISLEDGIKDIIKFMEK